MHFWSNQILWTTRLLHIFYTETSRQLLFSLANTHVFQSLEIKVMLQEPGQCMLKPVERSETDMFCLAEGLFMSTTRQSGLPAFPGYLYSPILQEWGMGWLRYMSSSWTLCWNLAHSWEAVGRSYVHHTDLSQIVPTLLAKQEEWTEEIRLTLIFIQFTGLQ